MSSPFNEAGADPRELEKARALFKAFQYREAAAGEIVLLGGLARPVVALKVGNAIGLSYKALGNGESYYHEFAGRGPDLLVNADGDQAFLVGGLYRFTSRGFVR